MVPTARQELLDAVDLVTVTEEPRRSRHSVVRAEPGADQAGLHDAVHVHDRSDGPVSLHKAPVPTGGHCAIIPGVGGAAVLASEITCRNCNCSMIYII